MNKCARCNAARAPRRSVETVDYTTLFALPGMRVFLRDVTTYFCEECDTRWIEIERVAPLVTDLEALQRKHVERVDCSFYDGEWHYELTARKRGPS